MKLVTQTNLTKYSDQTTLFISPITIRLTKHCQTLVHSNYDLIQDKLEQLKKQNKKKVQELRMCV